MLICFKETALQRNPGRTLEEIEKEYLRVYGKKKMIWLNKMPLMDKVLEGAKAGNYFGYGANGHTDEFVRFANDSTILIGLIDAKDKNDDPVSNIDFDILHDNLEILEQLFPGRTIVQINPLFLNKNGGGMHCASQQQPK